MGKGNGPEGKGGPGARYFKWCDIYQVTMNWASLSPVALGALALLSSEYIDTKFKRKFVSVSRL